MQTQNNKYHMLLWVVLIAFLGGGVPAFSKMALVVFPTFSFILLRFLLAGTILIPLFIKKKDTIRHIYLFPLIAVSLFGTGNVVFFAFGVQQTSATVSQVLYAAVPIIAALLSFFILKTPISKNTILGIFLGFIGVLIIILAPHFGDAQNNTGTIIGNLLILTAVLSYSLYTVYSKKLLTHSTPLTLTTSMVITTIVIQSLLIPTEMFQLSSLKEHVTAMSMFGVLYVGIIGTALYYLLYQHVINKANPLVASVVFYLQPIFSFLWAYILLHERLTLSLVIGSCLAFVGAGIVAKKES